MLRAVAQVASAAALGKSRLEDQRRLDGKLFEFRIRFGCSRESGEPAEDPVFSLRFDPETRTLRLRAAPDLAPTSAGIAPLVASEVEAVEGFWVRRPWLLTAGCPVSLTPVETEEVAEKDNKPAATPVIDPASSRHHVGIASFFTKSDSRTGRRDRRPYEVTKVLKADEAPSPQGYNLVLSGRLRARPQGQVINCRVTSPDSPPQCVVSAHFDRVWIELPQSKAVLAEWRR
ncbi:MAG TPA: hypothetical protein VJM15_00335 [Sphingomicrobium sp.]|nr:hypothetical protein [Sphingomicrobium sp.]